MKPSGKNQTKKLILLALGMVAVGALGVWYLRRQGFQFSQLEEALKSFPAGALALSAAAHAGVVLCSAFRVWLALPLPRAVRPLEHLHAIAAGQSVNLFLPARAGDVMKAWLLGRAAPAGKLSVLAAGGAVVADKIVDLICVALMAVVVGFSVLPRLMENVTGGFLIGLAIALVVLTATVVFAAKHQHPALIRFRRWLTSFADGLRGLGRPSVVLLGVVAGISTWIAEASVICWLAGCVGFSLGLDAALVALCTLYLGVAVPVSLANLGTFEAALALGLKQAGMPLAPALAVATVHHLGQLLGTTGLWLVLEGVLRVKGALRNSRQGTRHGTHGLGK